MASSLSCFIMVPKYFQTLMSKKNAEEKYVHNDLLWMYWIIDAICCELGGSIASSEGLDTG